MGKNRDGFVYHGLSFTGRRKENQDNFLAWSPFDNCHVLAVADGMGGTFGGEIASRIVVDEVGKYLQERLEPTTAPDQLGESPQGTLRNMPSFSPECKESTSRMDGYGHNACVSHHQE